MSSPFSGSLRPDLRHLAPRPSKWLIMVPVDPRRSQLLPVRPRPRWLADIRVRARGVWPATVHPDPTPLRTQADAESIARGGYVYRIVSGTAICGALDRAAQPEVGLENAASA